MRIALFIILLQCSVLMSQQPQNIGVVAVHGDSDVVSLLENHSVDPFSKEAKISFRLTDSVHVSVKITTMQGEPVRELVSKTLSAGVHTITWDGLCDNGQPAASGVFVYKIQTERITRSATLAMLN